MSATHAGLVFTKNGQAYNIDSPLDKSYIGQFDAPHYAGDGGADGGTGALHILRSKKMDERRRANFRGWVDKLVSALPRINGECAQVKFQSDYMVPAFVARQVSTQVTVTLLGKIILEQDRDAKLPMYCSEFAWHMLVLSNCTAEEIRNAPAEGAACVDPVFAPMPLIGDDRAPGSRRGAPAVAAPGHLVRLGVQLHLGLAAVFCSVRPWRNCISDTAQWTQPNR